MANKVWNGSLAGPQDWSVGANWTPSGVPATGDAVYILAGSATIEAGLGQIAVTLLSRFIGPNFSGTVGGPTTPLSISITNDTIDPTSVQRVNTNYGTVATTVTVLAGQGQSADNALGLEQIRIQGSNAANVLFQLGGQIGIATNSLADTANFPSISVLGDGTILSTAAGATLTVITQEGGAITINSALPTLNQDSGQLTTQGTGAVGSAALNVGGTLFSNSTGVLGNTGTPPNIRGTGTLDLNTYPAPRTVSGVVQLSSGATLNANRLWATLPNGFKTVGCKLSDVNVDVGSDRTLVAS